MKGAAGARWLSRNIDLVDDEKSRFNSCMVRDSSQTYGDIGQVTYCTLINDGGLMIVGGYIFPYIRDDHHPIGESADPKKEKTTRL